MARLNVVTPEQASGRVKELFDGIQAAIGMVPNIYQGAAGYNDAQAAEILLVIAQTVFTNLFNRVHQTPADFPSAPSIA